MEQKLQDAGLDHDSIRKNGHKILGNCHGAGLVAAVLSSGVHALAVQWVSDVFCVTRKHCYGKSVSLVPLRSIRFLVFSRSSVGFYELVITVWIQSL